MAALIGLGLSACIAPAHHYQVTRESQLKAVARDLIDGIASLPQGMILNELSEPLLGSDAQQDRPQRPRH